ncbi:MAG TPA: deoxyribonuclease IV [Candidatus Marinimicrobia bacterium]|nr:deoxyribonuclease IV [Candidatus Neomarinimicrobiota bacterium]
MPLIGCHVSIGGGVQNAPERGKTLGCDAIQIFTANQMQWKGAPISAESRDKYISEIGENDIKMVVSHDSYLINLGSPESVKLAMSRKSFIEEIERSTFLKIPYIVFHPGSHMGKGDDAALQTIAESLDYCMEKVPGSDVSLLLEITAGQGTNVGYKFEQLKNIIDHSSYPDRLGVCFDTCHAFAAGYNIANEAGYSDTFQKFDDIIGLDRLKVFHLNDSKKPVGSRVDRHHRLGEGFMGWEVFYRLVNDEHFANLPMILETPGDEEHYGGEIQLLKNACK